MPAEGASVTDLLGALEASISAAKLARVVRERDALLVERDALIVERDRLRAAVWNDGVPHRTKTHPFSQIYECNCCGARQNDLYQPDHPHYGDEHRPDCAWLIEELRGEEAEEEGNHDNEDQGTD